MSASETTAPTPRMRIDVDPTPAPPWTGKKFKCEKCPAEYQLEAGDQCVEQTRMEFESQKFATPACWDCGHVNVIKIEGVAFEGAGL
jgi:hypothetical protein